MSCVSERKFFECGVRNTFLFESKMINTVLDYVSGKTSYPHSYKIYIANPYARVMVVFSLGGLMGLQYVIAYILNPMLFFISSLYICIFYVCFFRSLQVSHMHYCIHRSFFENFKMNVVYASFISGFVICQNYNDYKREHFRHHSKKYFQTEKDADADLLINIMFIPGMDTSFYLKLLYTTIFSPLFHIRFVFIRFYGMIKNYNLYVAIGNFSIFSVYYFLIYSNFYGIAISVLFSQLVFYNISSLLQFLTEHAWFSRRKSLRDVQEYSYGCWARFCGARLEKTPVGWARWIFYMLCVAVPYRFGVVMGDLPVHDWHHLCRYMGGSEKKWMSSLYDREKAIEENDLLGLSSREVWGIKNALRMSFEGLSRRSLKN